MSLGLLVRAAGLKMALIDDPDASDNVTELALDHLLKAARLKMALVEDREALAHVQPMYEPRAAEKVRLGHDGRHRAKGRRKPKLLASGSDPASLPPPAIVASAKVRRGSKYG